jgi:hypothetical protein
MKRPIVERLSDEQICGKFAPQICLAIRGGCGRERRISRPHFLYQKETTLIL